MIHWNSNWNWNWNEDRARRVVDRFLPGDTPSRGLQNIPQTKMIPFHSDYYHQALMMNHSLLLVVGYFD